MFFFVPFVFSVGVRCSKPNASESSPQRPQIEVTEDIVWESRKEFFEIKYCIYNKEKGNIENVQHS